MPDKTPKYKIGEQEIDAQLFKQNLDNNVASYLDALDWTPAEKELFKQYYKEYSNNLGSDRFSSDVFYTITDNLGFLDETKPILFNTDGTRYEAPDFSLETDPEKLRKARERLAKYESKLHSFNPSKKVATFAKIVGQELLEALNKENATPQKPLKFNPDNVANNFEYYRLHAPARYYNDLRAREAKGGFNRVEILKNYLDKAYTDFLNAGYDENTVNTWTPRFLAAINALSDNNFGAGDYSALYPFFSRADLNNGTTFLDAYFADLDLTDLSPEQEAALQQANKAAALADIDKETQTKKNTAYLNAYNQFHEQWGNMAFKNISLWEDEGIKPNWSNEEIKKTLKEGYFSIGSEKPTNIDAFINYLWVNRSTNDDFRFHPLSEDLNAAALIREYAKINIPQYTDGWYFFCSPDYSWAILFDAKNNLAYKTWDGFFKNSNSYKAISAELNPTIGQFQTGGKVETTIFAKELDRKFSSNIKKEELSHKKGTVDKNKAAYFKSNYDPDENFWDLEDNWARISQFALDTGALLSRGGLSLGLGAAGTTAGAIADILDVAKGNLNWGSAVTNVGLNALGTATAALGIKGPKATKSAIQFVKIVRPALQWLSTAGFLANAGEILPTFQKNPEKWDKEDWQNALWAALLLISLKNNYVSKGRMDIISKDNARNNMVGIRTKQGNYILSGNAGKEARAIIADSKLTAQAKQKKLVPILEKEAGFNGIADDIKLISEKSGSLKWKNPLIEGNTRFVFGMPFTVNKSLNIHTFEPNYEWVLRPTFERKYESRFEGPELSIRNTEEPEEFEFPWDRLPERTPQNEPVTPTTNVEPTVLPKYPGEIPQIPKLETLLAEPSFTPTRITGTNLPTTVLKEKIELASNNLINIFNNKLGLDKVLNFSFKGRSYNLNKATALKSLKEYITTLKNKPTTDGSEEALIKGWLRYIGLFKTGGNINKFQTGGIISPELAALALQLKGNGTAPSLIPVYNPIDYIHQQEKEYRNWVDFSKAVKTAWEKDAAFKELGENASQYFDANGNLNPTKINEFSTALYNTNAYKKFNEYLTTAGSDNNYENLRNYFLQIYSDVNTPLKAMDWVTQWANVDASGNISWKPETLAAIRTSGYKFFDKNNILYPRMDDKPGTYHYTPDMITPQYGKKVHNYIPNETNDGWIEVEGPMPEDYTEYPIEGANDEYYRPNDNDSHRNVFYVKGQNPINPNNPSLSSPDDLEKTPDNVSANIPNALNSILRSAANLAPNAIAYARLRNLLWNTDEVTKKALAAEIPYLKDPVEKFRDVYGSLEDVNAGQRLFGKYNYAATAHPVTSDVATNQAFLLESWRRGAEEIINGLTKDNAMRRRTHELSIAQDHENVDNRHLVAMENRLQSLKTLKNKSAIEIARLNQIALDWDVFGQSLEYDFKNRLNERRSLQEGLDMKNAENTVMSNLDKYLAPGSPERQAYDAYLSGAELNDAQRTAYFRAVSAINNAIYSEYARMKGLYYVPKTEKKAGFVPKIQVLKIGGTVDFYRYGGHASKERIKNADRFIDSVKHLLKLNWKKLERLSKSMYKLPDKA